jgi:hypothetical protein
LKEVRTEPKEVLREKRKRPEENRKNTGEKPEEGVNSDDENRKKQDHDTFADYGVGIVRNSNIFSTGRDDSR